MFLFLKFYYLMILSSFIFLYNNKNKIMSIIIFSELLMMIFLFLIINKNILFLISLCIIVLGSVLNFIFFMMLMQNFGKEKSKMFMY